MGPNIYVRTMRPGDSLLLEILPDRSGDKVIARVRRDDTAFPDDPMSDLLAIPGFPVEIRVEVMDEGPVRVTMRRPEKTDG